jgi:putative DNA primase/helicase
MASFTDIFPDGFRATVMNSTDLADPVESFRKHCLEHGLDVADGVVPDGELHRVAHQSSKRHEKDGWYVLHLDGKVPVGVCGSFKEPSFESQWQAEIGRKLNWIEETEHRKWVEDIKRKREAAKQAAQEAAAERAGQDLLRMVDASPDHPYLQRKRVKPHGIKVNSAGELVVPIVEGESGEVVSYERIFSDGTKRFLSGGKKKGGFYEIRGTRQVVFVSEGFATGASVAESTGAAVFVAFDKGNLAPVAQAVRKMLPAAKIIIAADNDQFTDGNPGVTAAHEAARLVRGEVVYPIFTEEECTNAKPTDFNDLHCLRGLDEVRDQIQRVVAPMVEKMAFEFVALDDIELKPIQWIVEDYIEADSLCQVFGDPGGGKSFVAIDIACCIATGKPWHGHEVTQGSVFYIAGEGHNGLARRFKAWELGNAMSLKGAPIFKSKRAAQLYDASEAAIVAESINHLVDKTGHRPAMIVIDTLARNMGGDENSTQDMNAFVAHLDLYLRQPYKCCVAVVHHSGAMDKGRSRGSTALRGALDAEYRVQLDGTSGIIAFEGTKMKEAELPAPKNFNITQVDLPLLDKHGEPVKGAYLQAVDIAALVKQVNDAGEFLAEAQQSAMKAIKSLEYANEQALIKGDFAKPIDADALREACKANGLKQKNWKRTVDSLVKKGLIHESHDGTYNTSNHLKPPQ